MGRARRRRHRGEEGDSGDAARIARRGRGDRVARSRQSRRHRQDARHSSRVRLVRCADCRSRHRRGVHPAAESSARRVDDARGTSREARAVRKADRAERLGGAHAARGARPHRPDDSGSVHGPHASAVAEGPGDRAQRSHRRAARDDRLLQLLQRGSDEHPQHHRLRRRRADGHRLLSRLDGADDVRARTGSGDRRRRARPGAPDGPSDLGHPRLRIGTRISA